MITLDQLTSSSKVALLHSCTQRAQVSSNAIAYVHEYKVTYVKKDGSIIVIGKAANKAKAKARAAALAAAVIWANE